MAAILDAILKITVFPMWDFGGLLVCYSWYRILPKNRWKPVCSNLLGVRVFFPVKWLVYLLTFNLVCYFGNGTRQNRDRLGRVRRVAERVTGQDLPSLNTCERVLSKIDKIMADESHPPQRTLYVQPFGYQTARATHEQSAIPPVICPKFHPYIYIQPPCQKGSQFLALYYSNTQPLTTTFTIT